MKFHELEEATRTPFGVYMLGVGKDAPKLAVHIRNSQKFYIGDIDAFSSVGLPSDIGELHLPYPICAFEYVSLGLTAGVENNYIYLCHALDEPKNAIQLSLFMGVMASIKQKNKKNWVHLGSVLFDTAINRLETYPNADTEKNQTVVIWNNSTNSTGKSDLYGMLLVASGVLIRTLSVLNCSNVQVEEIPPSRVLNTIRRAKKKLPIYAYKTLVLKSKKKKILTNLGGTHESPRIHLRRGHIKRRKTGDFWWQSCVIGNREKGVIIKDYKADNITA
jgi:hypothetical protein